MAGPNDLCLIPRPNIAQLAENVRSELSKRLLGGAPVIPLSSEDILSFVMGGTVNLTYGYITQAFKERDPANMCCDDLVVYAAKRGINLRGATRAKGYVLVTGDPLSPISSLIRFSGPNGSMYKADPSVSFNPNHLDDTGRAVLRITATLPGSIFNLNPGHALTMATTAPGLDMEATVVGNGMSGGSDIEDCETLRRRVIDAESSNIISLNEAWYLRETFRYPGVTRACVEACAGWCDPYYHMVIFPFFEGVYGEDYRTPPYGVPPCNVIDEMNAYMWGVEPGRGQGIAPLGIRGSYQRAMPATISVSAKCFVGCPIGIEDRIRELLWDHIRNSYCVGSTICKDQLRAVIYRALGPDFCMSNITFDIDPAHKRGEDDSNIYLQCGTFAVVGDIQLSQAQTNIPATQPLIQGGAHFTRDIR